MMSTATAFRRACAIFGAGPNKDHKINVRTATNTTAGTKYDDTRSASCCTGARLRCASLTMRTICARRVSLPTRSARITSVPVPFTVPPVTRLPSLFSTGIGSPVTSDSSTELDPSIAIPSIGIFSPGRTRSTSPTAMCSTGMSSSVPSARTRRAVFGESFSSARMAADVRLRARNSSTWPSRTSAVITAAASKYTGTRPPANRNEAGKIPGKTTAIKL